MAVPHRKMTGFDPQAVVFWPWCRSSNFLTGCPSISFIRSRTLVYQLRWIPKSRPLHAILTLPPIIIIISPSLLMGKCHHPLSNMPWFYYPYWPPETSSVQHLLSSVKTYRECHHDAYQWWCPLHSEFLSTFVKGVSAGPYRKPSQMVLFTGCYNKCTLTCSNLWAFYSLGNTPLRQF